MSEETTSEQLAEIEGQGDTVQVREGRWRKRSGVEVSVSAMPTDHDDFTEAFPWWDGHETTWTQSGHLLSSGECPADLVEYIGPIEPQPQPQPQPQPEPQSEPEPQPQPEPEPQPQPIQVREGRWKTRNGEIKDIRPCDPLEGPYFVWPWTDGVRTFQDNGRHRGSKDSANDLVEYLGPIEEQPQPQPQPEPQAATIDELRSEVSYVQRLLGESNRKVAQLEDLVSSLRTINEAQEKAFEAAGQHNSDLQSRLNGVCSEWVQQAETIRRLQIELDAAQQVPADSPELRQLRADLAEVIQERDTYRHAHELLVADVDARHQRTKVMTIEAIVEWLVPIRTCGSQALATAVVSNLPHIMRSLTGLEDEGIE